MFDLAQEEMRVRGADSRDELSVGVADARVEIDGRGRRPDATRLLAGRSESQFVCVDHDVVTGGGEVGASAGLDGSSQGTGDDGDGA